MSCHVTLCRSNSEATRRADAEAEKALKRAKVLEERRAAKRASATPMDELEADWGPVMQFHVGVGGSRFHLRVLVILRLWEALPFKNGETCRKSSFCAIASPVIESFCWRNAPPHLPDDFSAQAPRLSHSGPAIGAESLQPPRSRKPRCVNCNHVVFVTVLLCE